MDQFHRQFSVKEGRHQKSTSLRFHLCEFESSAKQIYDDRFQITVVKNSSH